MKKNFKKQYRDLETQVQAELREMVSRSKAESQHVDSKALKVDVADYEELVIVNDRLTFLDANGYQYSVFANVTLEDLIDILEK